jgi:hypothetical protein
MPGTKALSGRTISERGALMGLFEQYPVLLVPVIIGTVELWNAVKRAVAARRRSVAERTGPGDHSE